MIPLEQEVVRQEGEIETEPYYVDGEAEVTVNFVGKYRTYSYTPIVDGNILKVREDGMLTAGKYDVEIVIVNPDGTQLRSMWEKCVAITNDNNTVLQEWDEFKEQEVEARAAVFFFAKGDKGEDGVGVPEGGTTGQVLAKASDDNFDTQWQTPTFGVSSVNGKTGEVTLNASDVEALPSNTPIPSALSDLTDDSSHRTVSDSEKSSWGGKQDAINDLDAIRSGAAAGATALQEETDPTVPAWAKTPDKPTYEYNEVGMAIANENGTTVASLTPNVYHKWGEVASLTISTLGALTDATKMAEYMIEFQSGSTPTVLSLPDGITWLNGENPASNISANKKYQISIVNNLGVYAEF